MDEVMSKKVTADAAAYIRSKAERRGRNVELAEKAVIESKSFTEKEALQGKLIDLVVNDVAALVKALEGREVTRFDGTRVTLRLDGQGLGTEISHPGLLFPGIVGTLCLILFLFATQIIPINWAGVLLVLLAIGLFAAEVKVASYGLLTVGGLAAMILGAMMLVDAPIPEMRVSLATLVPAALFMAAATILLVRLVLKAQRRRAVTGEAGMLGQQGVAQTEIRPEGWVKVAGERWRATADEAVAAGEKVTVTSVDGLTLRVRKGA
jgi:membrane-bound serine protease (ClpP class)